MRVLTQKKSCFFPQFQGSPSDLDIFQIPSWKYLLQKLRGGSWNFQGLKIGNPTSDPVPQSSFTRSKTIVERNRAILVVLAEVERQLYITEWNSFILEEVERQEYIVERNSFILEGGKARVYCRKEQFYSRRRKGKSIL